MVVHCCTGATDLATRGAALAFVALLFPSASWPWLQRAAAAGAASAVFVAGRRSASKRGWSLRQKWPVRHVDLRSPKALNIGVAHLTLAVEIVFVCSTGSASASIPCNCGSTIGRPCSVYGQLICKASSKGFPCCRACALQARRYVSVLLGWVALQVHLQRYRRCTRLVWQRLLWQQHFSPCTKLTTTPFICCAVWRCR